MNFLEGKTPKERKQLIVAVALGAVAIGLLGYLFLFASSSSGGATPNRNQSKTRGTTQKEPNDKNSTASEEQVVVPPQPIETDWQALDAPTAARNIFAYYVPPVKMEATPKLTPTQTPTPSPTPPWILVGINPPNVTARTADFTLEVTGDKFTPEARIYVDGQELQTQFTSAQRLTARVPAALIAAPGSRQIIVRSTDGKLYSNTATLNIAAPPTPPYIYIGLLARRNSANKTGRDTALLKKQGTNDEIISVQRGEVLPGGRFRVTSINELEIELVDTQLNITHKIPYTETSESPNNSFNGFRPLTPRVTAPGAIQPAGSDEP
jgi:hypothetical protein